jgi:general secretion pathway protein I
MVVNGEDGFTLLEVMIAVAIVAISIVALMGSQLQSVSMADIAKFNITASLLAQQKISELELIDFSTLTTESGEFDVPFDNYQYQLEVNSVLEEDTGIPDADILLKSVDLSIISSSDHESPYHLHAIIMTNQNSEKP